MLAGAGSVYGARDSGDGGAVPNAADLSVRRFAAKTYRVHAILFKDGESAVGHPAPPWFSKVAKGERAPANTLLGRLNPHSQLLKASMDGSDGHHYTLVT